MVQGYSKFIMHVSITPKCVSEASLLLLSLLNISKGKQIIAAMVIIALAIIYSGKFSTGDFKKKSVLARGVAQNLNIVHYTDIS